MGSAAGTVLGAIVLLSPCPAMAQDRSVSRDDEAAFHDTSYDLSGPVSPSSATSTVSPSSVPQAMERLNDNGLRADLSLGLWIGVEKGPR